MKKALICCLVSLLLLPLLMAGCESNKQISPTTTTTSTKSQTVEITLDEFTTQKTILKYVEMVNSGTLTIRLGANPTTGYSWTDAAITHPEVIKQISRNYEGPANTGVAGSGGTEVWVFKAADTGLAMIKMSYGRPWEGGEKDTYTVTININVR